MSTGEKVRSDLNQHNTFLSSLLSGRKILLVVTGGIALFKSCYLIRDIRRTGGEVQVVMTESATRFISPLTFTTLSGKMAEVEMFPDSPPLNPIHLTLADWAEIMVVAPCSANFMAKIAHGIADDLASTVALAVKSPILLAPAMNSRMWTNPAVQDNRRILSDRGIYFAGPVEGAMGGVNEEPGIGRMIEPSEIISHAENILGSSQSLKGKKILVTTGPTREYIDPVRFISNRSSGRMGNAIAKQALLRNADVVLIRGRGSEAPPPFGVTVVEVESASDMAQAVKQNFDNCDALVMAAAVADWTVDMAPTKLKKKNGAPELKWQETEDILAWASSHKTDQVITGFALETSDHISEAQAKLTRKGADLIALNDPTREDSAFGGDTNKITLIRKDAPNLELPLLTKDEAARKILDEIEALFPAR